MAASLLSCNRRDSSLRCGGKSADRKELRLDIQTAHCVMSFDTTALLAAYSGWSERPNSRVARSAYRGIAEEDNSNLRLGSTLSSVHPAKIPLKRHLRVRRTLARYCDKAVFAFALLKYLCALISPAPHYRVPRHEESRMRTALGLPRSGQKVA